MTLRNSLEIQPDLSKMGICGEDAADAQLQHNGKAGQIGNRDARLIPVAKPKAISLFEPVGVDRLNRQRSRLLRVENALAKCRSAGQRIAMKRRVIVSSST